MSVHAFVDETTRNGYMVAAAVLLPADLDQARKVIKGLVMKGQNRLHFAQESDARRRTILSAMVDLGPEVLLYDASQHRGAALARQRCLEQLVVDLAGRDARRLVIEQADSFLQADRRTLYQQVRLSRCEDTLAYSHHRAKTECLLAIPDAVAWSWTKGGDWKARVRPLVTEVRSV